VSNRLVLVVLLATCALLGAAMRNHQNASSRRYALRVARDSAWGDIHVATARLKRDKTDREAAIERADACMVLGLYAEAANDYGRAMLPPGLTTATRVHGSPELFYQRGRAFELAGSRLDAEEHYRTLQGMRAQEADPSLQAAQSLSTAPAGGTCVSPVTPAHCHSSASLFFRSMRHQRRNAITWPA
jgi:hypothetical protein